MKKFIKKVLFYSQRMLKSYQVRTIICKIQCFLKGKLTIEGSSKLVEKSDEQSLLVNFRSDGYVEVPEKLTLDRIDAIKSKVRNFNLFDPFHRGKGTFKIENVPNETHVANFRREDLLNVPEILEIANDPGILRIVQEYLGCKPSISNVNMWWSIAGKNKAEDAQLFHRDVDDIKFCKLFIYLTDVGPNDGPHTYVEGSPNTNKLTKIRRYQDEEIETAFGKDKVIQFIRDKGSCFLVDTYGFHKGLLPKENNRLLLQVQYSINPIGIENYEPQSIEANYNKYINRFILK